MSPVSEQSLAPVILAVGGSPVMPAPAPIATPVVVQPPRIALVLAAVSPIAVGAVLAARAGNPALLAVTPAVVFGVVAASCPALYIGLAATKEAVTLTGVVRALRNAIAAFGMALAGLVLPAVFLSMSSTSHVTTLAVCGCALGGAGVLAMVRLAGELSPRSFMGAVVMLGWMLATLGIAGRLWFDSALEVLS